ncbi:tRNA epoxyqueuosine(34) reductase QueG [Zeimonas arvi]|uniref:Epoxyqueuosine reductase n=1 Tax=Zeimonas arvi TaxID=2498847 RepID=A0A5C8P5Y6_9BURK|nr:tRNA epoxyqueuosine(34) reductase QueG [Zeimonas arvi]TXL68655.1 tRNA epoxyqueuosine(34) reductase QueG [Zeimonas arvi]
MSSTPNLATATLRQWAAELGFASLGVAGVDLSSVEGGLQAWLDAGWHGEMDYMARHGMARARPAELVPGTVSAIMVTLDYAPEDPGWVDLAWRTLAQGERAYLSRYALGRDYHKVVRARLQKLAERIAAAAGPFGHRVFCDSAPVMEVELARRAGLGWRGKHTLLIHPKRGSTFFLGTLYTDLPLPADEPEPDHCGSCTRCIEACPTGAIVSPWRLDARRCISYLTIELKGAIPEPLRAPIGNRIYGCDDCQLACPWNRFAQPAGLPDFAPRNGLDAASLVELFRWSAEEFDARLAGSPIRRIGHERWLRNIAVALGNAGGTDGVRGAEGTGGGADAIAVARAALAARADHPSALVREHVGWALAQLERRAPGGRNEGGEGAPARAND